MRLSLKLAFLVPLLLPTQASADSLSATRGQALTEAKHEVRVRVRNGIATYKVKRTFKNAGKRHEEAVIDLGLPFGAAATGLRIKTPSGWYSGKLMRAERAARIYQELTGFGPHTVKDPALLSWRWANELNLRIFPVAPEGGTSTIEYTLTGPTRYQDGRYIVSYPMGSAGMATPMLRAKGDTSTSNVWLDGKPVQVDRRIALSPPEVPTWAEPGQLPARYSYSEITVGDDLAATKLSIAIDVRHTFRGDLRVQLVPPEGAWHNLVGNEGGGENDIRKTVDVVLSKTSAVSVKGTWRLVVSDHAALDVGSIDAWSITLDGGTKDKKFAAHDTPKFIPDAPSGEAGNMAVIQFAPPAIRTVAARLGRVEASKKKQFFRLEVDAAPQLRPMPKKLSVVFVVDASKSVMRRGLSEQLTIVRSFLRNAPQAHAEIVLYRRHAVRLFGDFVSAGDVAGRIKKLRSGGKLDLGNGSALDEGIRVAGKALGLRRGTRMIVMLNDDLLRPSWTNQRASQLLSGISLRAAHMVMPRMRTTSWIGDARERRDDKHHLSKLALRTGGILLHIDDPGDDNKELDDVTLGLVRPNRIDQLRVHGVSLPANNQLPGVLREGQGIREMALLESAPGKIRLTGKIWARPFSRLVEGPLTFSQATAAFVFSHDLHHKLSEKEMVRVAFAGKVVSPVTSYLAIEPGVRPSTMGLEGTGEGGGGFGEGIGLGSIGTIGHGGGTCPAYTIEGDVSDAVDACVAKHKPAKGWAVSLKVDTTFDEVVDVVHANKKRTALAVCIEDAVWTATLSSCTFNEEREQVTVSFP